MIFRFLLADYNHDQALFCAAWTQIQCSLPHAWRSRRVGPRRRNGSCI